MGFLSHVLGQAQSTAVLEETNRYEQTNETIYMMYEFHSLVTNMPFVDPMVVLSSL